MLDSMFEFDKKISIKRSKQSIRQDNLAKKTNSCQRFDIMHSAKA